MAATTSTPPKTEPAMTWEAFERLPDGDGLHREIIEGELQILPPVKSKHSKIATKLFEVLLPLQQRGLGSVFLEAGYKLSEKPPTWIQPDASFLKTERVRETPSDGYFTGAPELAVEIVSPSETAVKLQRKVELLLGGGALAVWVIYPETQTVSVHLPDGTSVTRLVGDMLTAPFLLKGWELPVATLFEGT
ncbi:MAG TPA: Uma2 family endonuclease [Bryobacteraceae bacterium]|nr:Uma2 family endonuclease [Bryobacteraceae bacterium]